MKQTDLQGETERALRADILGAVTRGWCSPNNAAKVMDADLAEAITAELLPLFNAGIVGAYAAAAKHLESRASELEAGANNYPNFQYSGNDPFAKERHSCVLECREQANKIRDLTPADARQAQSGERMECGHPVACQIASDDASSVYSDMPKLCGWCHDKAKLKMPQRN